MNYRDFYPPESVKILNNEVAPTLERGEGWEGEMEALDANGRLFPLWERADSIPDEDGKLLFGFGIMHDISNRKEVEKQIKDSLREKETLLKEIHHRVKNNINIILALLKLQENNSKDPKLKSALKDSQNRLRTMSMIHEALYRTDNMSSINMKAYLEELGNTILSGYAGNENMRFHTSIEDIILSVKQASPIGLIINELITNSLKYAFPDERPKEIFF